jgi:hypothetical protein
MTIADGHGLPRLEDLTGKTNDKRSTCRRGEELIMRLFNPTGERLATQVELPWLPATAPVALAPFALLTLRVARDGEVMVTDLLETPVVSNTGDST